MDKIVRENINEALRRDGHTFDLIKFGNHEKIVVGEDGIMGMDDIFLPWDMILRMAKKYKSIQ